MAGGESLLNALESCGAGLFVQDGCGATRLDDATFHRAFNEPVFIWFDPIRFDSRGLQRIVPVLRRLHRIVFFRFPRGAVNMGEIERLRKAFPDTRIEGWNDDRNDG